MVSVALAPGEICAVPLPAHVLAEPPFELEQTKKVCGNAPLLVTLKVTEPVGTDVAESLNLNSDGEPAATVTVFAVAFAGCAIAGSAHASITTDTSANMRTRSLVIRSDPSCICLCERRTPPCNGPSTRVSHALD